jgi:hypothetical protein
MNVKKKPCLGTWLEQEVGGDRENAPNSTCPSPKVKPSVENNLLTAALKYAARGKRVFPCSLDKKPLTQNGFKDATTDAATIKAWWGKHPQASIGMRTGEVSGIFVLDVDVADGKKGYESLAALEEKYGKLPETLCIRTGSGGRHFYFKYPAGHELGNSTGKLGPGLDTRGEGGYVIMPPSRHVSGGNYKVENLGTPLADLPAEFIPLLEKPKFEERPAISKTHPTPRPGELPPYVQKAIDGELQKLATTQKGERNDALNKAAYALGQWVGGGYINEGYADSLLWKAANENGLALEDATECRKTIQSGLTAGMMEPRAIPDRSTATEMPVEGTKTGNVESRRMMGCSGKSR